MMAVRTEGGGHRGVFAYPRPLMSVQRDDFVSRVFDLKSQSFRLTTLPFWIFRRLNPLQANERKGQVNSRRVEAAVSPDSHGRDHRLAELIVRQDVHQRGLRNRGNRGLAPLVR